ncbi:MAG: type II toxin-antitoxin system prevent-host-death family antitoxin [Verrucomicrobiota bacterium]|nr:type II toxin-antitoxin system prevent-host-death family antitoxin [Deltaproteobacteria bacterium]MCS5539283.1 type II toxin-antitoxin system Phd/YefM family antitoxin [Roseibacillus sp.]MEE2623894.1 type II toxin-antitoxin system prevent-host-death family antitoxin [Verrucomicrobiota bacterium]HAT18784.1 type II toxin-antitoxin system prevent-host-death family antitoxin [Verrucomicrobiales bacterium]
MRRIGIFEAKTKLSAIVAEIMADGEIFQITKHGRAVAELRPPTGKPVAPQRGTASGPGFWMADDFDEPL